MFHMAVVIDRAILESVRVDWEMEGWLWSKYSIHVWIYPQLNYEKAKAVA